MPRIRPLSQIAQKWATVTPQRQGDYSAGVAEPRADWKTQTLAGAKSYETGVQAAIANKSFDKGVSNAGTQKWQSETLKKGPGRWAQGVQEGQSAYETGFAPYQTVIANTVLPARGPKGDPVNIQRVAVLAKALNDRKKAATR